MKRNVKLWESFSGSPYMSDDMMPAGEYWIGDLCYVMGDKWDKFCDLTISGDQDIRYGKVNVDGAEVAFLGTKYGDGTYNDQMGRMYPVDAGLIGAIKVEDITDPNALMKYGHVVNFNMPWDFHDDDGLLVFGKIMIQTGDAEEDEDHYDEDDYY